MRPMADLYGAWYVLTSRPNPLFNEDPAAPDPRAFHRSELPAQLPNNGAMHMYQMKLTKWEKKVITDVIGYIL